MRGTEAAIAGVLFMAMGCAAVRHVDGRCTQEPLGRVVRNSRWTIEFDARVDPASIPGLMKRAEAAWQFDLTAYNWQDPKVTAEPVEFRVFSCGKQTAETTQRWIELPAEALDAPDFDGVLAHELSHLQFVRMGVARSWPRYLNEGQSYVLGAQYRALTGGFSAGDAIRRRQEERLTAERASVVIEESRKWSSRATDWKDRRADGFRNATGILFVRFLCQRASGCFHRLGTTAVALQTGATLDAAFASGFGRGLGELEDEFVRTLEPARRSAR